MSAGGLKIPTLTLENAHVRALQVQEVPPEPQKRAKVSLPKKLASTECVQTALASANGTKTPLTPNAPVNNLLLEAPALQFRVARTTEPEKTVTSACVPNLLALPTCIANGMKQPTSKNVDAYKELPLELLEALKRAIPSQPKNNV